MEMNEPKYLFENGNPAEVKALAEQSLKKLLIDIHSPVKMDELWVDFQETPLFQDMISHWSDWHKAYRERQWEALCREIEKTAYGTRPYCLRCGECCRKGSPTLYGDDLGMLHLGMLHRMDLITLRPGEIGFSNATNDLVLLTEERVKVKEKSGTRECLLFEPENNGCRIYENRPLQCQVMECWNPDLYQSLDSHSFLTRRDLLNPDDPLVPVIEAHAKRCALSKLQEALSKIRMDPRLAQEEAMDILQYDLHLREVFEKNHGIGPENQVFLFGRALVDLIPSLGFGFKKKSDGTTILVPLVPEVDS
jgi:Fe-S-cluster containining protein